MVLVFNNAYEDAEWTRVAFGINIDEIANYDTSYNVLGTNNQNSIDSYFLDYADGLAFSNLRLYDDDIVWSFAHRCYFCA